MKVWDTRFVLFCFVSTLGGILLAVLLSMGLKDRRLRGEFIQASYRSSAALLGIAFIKNIYGDAGMAPLMIIGSVPLYNVMAVVILAFTSPGVRSLTAGCWGEQWWVYLRIPSYWESCPAWPGLLWD